MSLHTNIGEEFFPIDVADPNQLTSYYESYVLIPNLGPLLYSKLYGKLKRVVNDFSSAINLIDDINTYYVRYKEIPPTPYIPADIVVFGSEISEGAATSGFKIDEAYARPNTLPPQAVLRSLSNIGTRVIKSAPVANFYTTDDERMESYKTILSGLSLKNTAISALVDKDLMLGSDGVVSKKFLAAKRESQVETMVASFVGAAEAVDISGGIREFSTSITTALIRNKAKLSKFGAQLVDITAISVANFFDRYGIVNPADHITVANSCEWAFLRKERVTLDLRRPLFRGPLNVNSVSPNSELTLTETQSRISTSGTRTLIASSDDLTEYNSISSEIKSKLGILFDYGSNLGQTMSEQGYTQDNMKSEKRSRVESALLEISQQNSTVTVSTQTLSSSEIREYHTEGKDPKFATSELSFEVFSPIRVSHYLDDISAVWAPRMKNPFSELRASLTEYYMKTYFDYIQENYVIDPMEPIPSYENVNRVTRDTAYESDPGTFTKKVTFKLTANEIATGHLFGEDIQLEFHQHCDWYENCYDDDDRWMKVHNVDRHGGDSWVDVTIKYHVDNVTGNDPDRTYITVSIDKYKETEAYRQEMKEYTQTVGKTNPARRNAIKVQARKYAALKRDELIRKYESNIKDLKDLTFTSLIRKMFSNNVVDDDWSYYLGIIRSCIDWDRSRIEPEPCSINDLYATVLSPYHFLNVQAVRFFLPINVGAEAIFFDTMRKVVDPTWRSLFNTVERYIKDQRNKFMELNEAKRLIDRYDSELILGRHLEAVLSNKAFAE
ncbi:hypothetical protein [uncultured Desulfosarcina sp.]|uniref:hypothetical protein n=1 Tax=uncultured Desulfosarcina sp. TaxID=218289 RepID=UPI0029C91180|nr:hypothetical protein [uncultured Desulfosarcina sp.]